MKHGAGGGLGGDPGAFPPVNSGGLIEAGAAPPGP